MKAGKLKTRVTDYMDFIEFLGSAYKELHDNDTNFSYRYLQKKAGYSSGSNHFWQILKGRTPLSQRAARRYGKALGLKERDILYMQNLVAFQYAKTDEERNDYLALMKRHPDFSKANRGSQLGFEYYSHWYLPALRALVSLDDFVEDHAWIAGRISPRISVSQARRGIELLLELGFLRRDEAGKLVQSEAFIGDFADRKGDDETARLALRNYHRAMIALAGQAIENHCQNKRYVVGSTLALSEKQAERLRPMIREFMQQVEQVVAEDDGIDCIYRLNVQLFPLLAEKQAKSPTRVSKRR